MKSHLNFDESTRRLTEIEVASSGTFDWIFDNSELGFVNWLRNDFGLYWIRGKPGSGKSTLMKFLRHSPPCSQIFTEWQRQRNLVTVWYFFHERGSLLQKSFEGLLRTILLQMFSQLPQLAELVLDFYPGKGYHKGGWWSIADLEQALTTILEQKSIPLDIVLFIDALDEYHGPPEIIADFLRAFSLHSESLLQGANVSRFADESFNQRGTRLKVCFSSRPWDVFVKRFEHCPGFKMHEQTKHDVRVYATRRFEEFERLKALDTDRRTSVAETSPTYDRLIESIVQRAEGVFLWVKLVIDRIIEASDGKMYGSIDSLERLLSELPDKLEDLYIRSLNRISLSLRHEAFAILEIVYCYPGTLYLDVLFDAFICWTCTTFQECVEQIQRRRPFTLSQHDMSVHLKNRCGGLLEIIGDGRARVQFIHLTVRDLVSDPNFKKQVLNTRFDSSLETGFSTLTKYQFTQLVSKRTNDEALELAISFAHSAEVNTGRHQGPFFDSVPDALFSEWAPKPINSDFNRKRICDCTMAFGVIADLRIYLRAQLESKDANSKPLYLTSPVSGASLLHFAAWRSMQYLSQKMAEVQPIQMPQGNMIRLLTECGATLSSRYNNLTPFESLFSRSFDGVAGSTGAPIEPDMVEAAKAMLELGQSPNVWLHLGLRSAMEGLQEYETTPLHLSHSPMSEVLLLHGAEVNKLDNRGRTALDVCISSVGDSLGLGLPRETKEAYETAAALLSYGGRVTHHGIRALPYFSKALRKTYPELPKSFYDPPQLSIRASKTWSTARLKLSRIVKSSFPKG